MKKSTQSLIALGLAFALSAALVLYYNTYVYWKPKAYPFAVTAILAGVMALTLFVLWARDEREPKALAWKTALSVFVFAAALIGVSAIINNGIYRAQSPGAKIAAAVAMPLAGVQIVTLFVLLLRNTLRAARLGAAIAAVMLIPCILGIGGPWYMKEIYRAPAPPELSEGRFAPFGHWDGTVDFTVLPGGRSIEEVRDLIREARAGGDDKHFNVEIFPGEYNIKHIEFDERDYNTTYSTGNGGVEAILNGGMRLKPKDFVRVTWLDASKQLSGKALENVRAIDLKKLGLDPDDWGKMYSFGAFTTAAKYDGGVGPLPCELFFNGVRCVTARYPNGDAWLKIAEVTDNGESGETYEGGTNRRADWDEARNPRGGTFAMDKKTAARAAKWATIDDVWMFGCFKWDWADMSTPVKAIDRKAGTVTTAYASNYGFARGGTYYYYNVLEELDEPGEWYLDREAGLLYLWPPAGDFTQARIDLSLSTQALIEGEGLENITLRGLTLQGTRGDGMYLKGDNITVEHCVVRNIAGSAITVEGYNNTISDCEVYRVGKQGITIRGGDQATLKPGNSRAVNNLVHDWPEVVMTYQGGVNVYGTGNLAAHNEIYNSPHSAMFFGGNNHVIEHNLIHDVCLITDDAGAIYNGRSLFSAQGTVIRRNVLYDIGGRGHTPDGIYLDDGLSGVSILDNLLVNVPGSAIAISGRDLEVHGNVVVNAGSPVSYDQRTRDGALATDPNFWFHAHTGKGGDMWRDLEASPWQTDIWKAAYPKLAALSTDFENIEQPEFAANPAGSNVTGNVFAGQNKPGFSEGARRFSTVEPNDSFGVLRGMSYWTLPGYKNIQIEKAGRTLNWGLAKSF